MGNGSDLSRGLSFVPAFLIIRPETTPKVNWLGKIRTAVLMSGIAPVALGRIPELTIVVPIGLVVISAGTVLHALAGVVYGNAIVRSPRSRNKPNVANGADDSR